MITLAMDESAAKVVLIALSYAARHGKEVFCDEKESVKQVRGVAAQLENNIGDAVIGAQPLQNQ
jgi:hypothetical protein